MSSVLEQIHKIRSSDVTVLITGESGTGKELIARAVHAGSSRRFNTFLPFNCSAAPKDMVESQLFGYRKGAFTGAIASNEGVVRAAERGTLFLDEIGDLPLDLQPKLLRFLAGTRDSSYRRYSAAKGQRASSRSHKLNAGTSSGGREIQRRLVSSAERDKDTGAAAEAAKRRDTGIDKLLSESLSEGSGEKRDQVIGRGVGFAGGV